MAEKVVRGRCNAQSSGEGRSGLRGCPQWGWDEGRHMAMGALGETGRCMRAGHEPELEPLTIPLPRDCHRQRWRKMRATEEEKEGMEGSDSRGPGKVRSGRNLVHKETTGGLERREPRFAGP